MNAHTHRQRVAFLNLKASLGTITPDEREEMERLASLQVIETTGGGPVIIAPKEETPGTWKSKVAERNAAEQERAAERRKSIDPSA